MVLMYYLGTDFEGGEKPKGGPLESEIFLLMGVNERSWRGVRSLLKTPSTFLITRKIKFLNMYLDNT